MRINGGGVPSRANVIMVPDTKVGGNMKRLSLATLLAVGLAANTVLVLTAASCVRAISSPSEIRAGIHPWVGQSIDELIRK